MENKQVIQLEEENSRRVEDENTMGVKASSNVFYRIIDRLNQGLVIVAGLSLISMMLLIVFNAIKRQYSDPIAGTVEIVSWLAAITTIFSLGYAQLHKGHVFIELLFNKFSILMQKVVHTFTNLLSIVFFLIATWQIVLHGIDLMNQGVVSQTMQIAFYPLVLLCSIGFFSLALALVKETILVWKGVS